MQELGRHAKNAVDRLAFNAWLRAGFVPDDLADLARGLDAEDADDIGHKFNPNHDERGRFTFGPGGASGSGGYRGMTKGGIGTIKPTSGGGVDQNGRHIPEQFPPDPYALRTPADALAHYAGGSGEDRNYYFNNVDTSRVKPTDFPDIAKLVAKGGPGIHLIKDAIGEYRGGTMGKIENLTSAATVGRLVLRADGALIIAKNGSYQFSGTLSAKPDRYDFNPDPQGRSTVGELSTTVGSLLPGKPFKIHLIGSKPFSGGGHR